MHTAWHMVNNARTESRLFISRWWSYRHGHDRCRMLLRACIADIRAANALIGK